MIELFWWHWAILGFGLVLAELVVPTFVLVWFGLGSFLVMALLLVAPDANTTAQVLLWTLSSILMVVLWFKVFKKGQHKIFVGRASANIDGEVGMLIEPVEPFRNGKVRFQRPILGSDTWECVSDEKLAIGTRVKVLKFEGSRVTVTGNL